jgi:hypothetical protein
MIQSASTKPKGRLCFFGNNVRAQMFARYPDGALPETHSRAMSKDIFMEPRRTVGIPAAFHGCGVVFELIPRHRRWKLDVINDAAPYGRVILGVNRTS